MVVHHVNHQLHAMLMHHIRKIAKILHRTVFGIDLAVVSNRIRRAQASLPLLPADGMNGQKPHRVHAQIPNARDIFRYCTESTAVVAHEDGI